MKSLTGEGGRNLKVWIKDMEKVGMTINRDDERMKVLAIQTLKGSAAKFVSRALCQNPQITWPALIQQLRNRFSDTLDVQLAMQCLRRLTQNTGESVQGFAECIVDLAEEAYNTVNLNDPIIQFQLKDIFLDGIKDDSIARKIINN